MPAIINGPEITPISSDKAKYFESIFTSNSMLYYKGYSLPYFTKHRELSRLITNTDTKNAINPNKIPVVVLKSSSPELSANL